MLKIFKGMFTINSQLLSLGKEGKKRPKDDEGN